MDRLPLLLSMLRNSDAEVRLSGGSLLRAVLMSSSVETCASLHLPSCWGAIRFAGADDSFHTLIDLLPTFALYYPSSHRLCEAQRIAYGTGDLLPMLRYVCSHPRTEQEHQYAVLAVELLGLLCEKYQPSIRFLLQIFPAPFVHDAQSNTFAYFQGKVEGKRAKKVRLQRAEKFGTFCCQLEGNACPFFLAVSIFLTSVLVVVHMQVLCDVVCVGIHVSVCCGAEVTALNSTRFGMMVSSMECLGVHVWAPCCLCGPPRIFCCLFRILICPWILSDSHGGYVLRASICAWQGGVGQLDSEFGLAARILGPYV